MKTISYTRFLCVGVALIACGRASPAEKRCGEGESADKAKAVAVELAAAARDSCSDFIAAFLDRVWVERKNPLTDGDLPDVERKLLDVLAAVMTRHADVDSVSVVYANRALTGERRASTDEERRIARKSSVGDMYAGPLRERTFGEPIAEGSLSSLVVVVRGTDRLFADVPVTKNGRYVCGLLVIMREAEAPQPNPPSVRP